MRLSGNRSSAAMLGRRTAPSKTRSVFAASSPTLNVVRTFRETGYGNGRWGERERRLGAPAGDGHAEKQSVAGRPKGRPAGPTGAPRAAHHGREGCIKAPIRVFVVDP